MLKYYRVAILHSMYNPYISDPLSAIKWKRSIVLIAVGWLVGWSVPPSEGSNFPRKFLLMLTMTETETAYHTPTTIWFKTARNLFTRSEIA